MTTVTIPRREKVKYSIIVVSWNTITELTRCVESVFRWTKDFEMILVDNGSHDGSAGYIKELEERLPNVFAVYNEENMNFGPAQNQGYEMSNPESEFVVCLNSDCCVTEGWLDRMTRIFAGEEKCAMVGPVSNNSNGRQMIAGGMQGLNVDQAAASITNNELGRYAEAGLIYGWCMVIDRKFLNDEPHLFDDRFSNSYEDNDLCLRARMKGWRIFIDCSTFIFHEGQASFKKNMNTKFMEEYQKNGRKNQELFFEKWRDDKPKKLIAVYRIANCEQYIRRSMEQTSKFADEIICLFARSKDATKNIALSFPKVTAWEEWSEDEHPFDEQAERNWLLQKAIERGADWVISVDGDEYYEDKFIEMVPRLINPNNPQVFGYWCNWRTVWARRADGMELFRSDGIFGGFQNYRFHRVIPGMEIKPNDNIYNHHCGSAPYIPQENLRWLNVRVRHLGYDTEEQRIRKYEFYRKADPRPLAKDVGNADYHHLIDRNVGLKLYRPMNRLALMSVVKNEGDTIFDMLSCVEAVIDEFVIVDTGSTDNTIEEIERFSKFTGKKIKVYEKKFESMVDGALMNYSEAKNFGKSMCTSEWILNMDGDELFNLSEATNLFAYLEEDCDGFLFRVINYLEPPRGPRPEDNVFSFSETIRLYRNIDELFYSGLIHESLEDAAGIRFKNGRGQLLEAKVMIHHRGYLRPKDRIREKINRYHAINELQFEASGKEDPRPLFNMALHYMNDGNPEKAVEMYQSAIKKYPQFWRAHQNLGYHYASLAKRHMAAAVGEMPGHMKQNNKATELHEFFNKFNFDQVKIG